jgi:transposase, IS30 family
MLMVLGKPGLPWSVRSKVWEAWAGGASARRAAVVGGVSGPTVGRWLRETGGVRPRPPRPRSPLRLSLAEREEISRGISARLSYAEIGRRIGRPACTVSREVARNGGRFYYRAVQADRRAELRARRPKPAKLAVNTPLRDVVAARLVERWSPQQISKRLKVDFPDDEAMQVSHETIYTSLYVQARGALRRELAGALRTGRAMRVPRRRAAWLAAQNTGRGKIPNMVLISERPAEAADRAVPGHWEGDLLVGKDNASAIGTLVERATRFVMLVHLGEGKTAEAVAAALARKIVTLPAALRRSLTWDQGSEMARHLEFTTATGLQVYFCDPHSPWQRGSNENTNGLLRQCFPKGSDLSVHSPDRLDAVAAELNGRPRQTLGWKTPAEALDLALAAAA